MSENLILRVAVPAPLYSCFDYLAPDGVDPRDLLPGMRLLVPFGRGERCGVLLELVTESELGFESLKQASKLLDAGPLLGPDDLELLLWAAEYYRHPIGDVVASALPVRLRKGKPRAASGLAGWRLTPAGVEQAPDSLTRAPRQAQVLHLLQQHGVPLSQVDIYRYEGECRSILRALEQRGWIEPCDVEAPKAVAPKGGPAVTVELNRDQQKAVDAVNQSGEIFQSFLLDGITGSGKTEVYMALVERALAAGRQVLILVPEIGLTPQLMQRFQERIGAPMALLHSARSDLEREQAWSAAARGEAAVVLGTRSAVFTPMPRLGLVIVDEEHDLSFKQQDGFRYSARDLALVRAQRRECPVILGSATPSLESLRNAQTGRYAHLLLLERAGNAVPPRLDILDIRSVHLDAGISPTLFRMMQEEIQAGNQTLLFLNRRGYSPLLSCYDCGWIAECRRCDARLTYHMGSGVLWCHHCGSQRRVDQVCPECKGEKLKPLGQGTERLEEVLAARFPDVGIVRIDRDSTRRKGSLQRLLGEIHQGRHRLLLGTQMLAKGHHFPNVTLVGILDVDQGLFGADYRAAERMAQLITQVSGRAGRAEKPGRVVVQTRHPDHPLIHTLVRNGYGAFAMEALQERQAALLPPYSHQALVRAEATTDRMPRAFLDDAMELGQAMGAGGVEFWGPVPAPMERRAGSFRAHLLVQSNSRGELQRLLAVWLPQMRGLKSARRVRWSVDVDPQEML
ncbi:MAG: primosomal protein N' [Gammaproteobacteria bacterium]|nr:primosomal protein N' [Gammaproteobacteria bacterium]